jgi:trigger factor
MKITKDQITDLTATIQITIEGADYEQEVTKELKEYQRKANMPGFRPGKVPFGMVKKMYGNAVIADKVNKLISESLNNYIIDNKMEILGHPVANMEKTGMVDFDKDTEHHFFFDIGFAPEIKLDFEGLDKPVYLKAVATEKAIDEAVEQVLARGNKLVPVDTVEANDTLSLKLFEADEDGNEVVNGKEIAFSFKLEELANDEARAVFIGKESGAEFVYKLADAFEDQDTLWEKLKLDESDKDLALGNFNIIIDEVQREEKAELNKEFFDEVFPGEDIEKEEDFRKRLAQDMEKQYTNDTDRYFFTQAVEAMIAHHTFEMPDEFMKKWLIDNNEGKVTAEEIENDYEKINRTFRWQLIQAKLELENEQLNIKPEEIRNFVKGYFFGRMQGSDGVDEEMDNRMDGIVDTILQNKDEVNKIKDQLQDQKLMAFLKERINPKEETMSFDDFIKLVSKKNKENE